MGRLTRLLPAAALAAGSVAGLADAPEPAPAERPADAERGRRIFIRCIACHSVSAEARPGTGPHLEAIVGRKVASVEGFAYTDALRARSFVWDEARLDTFLEHPQAEFPGMCITFRGLPKPEDRRALIAYLKNPLP